MKNVQENINLSHFYCFCIAMMGSYKCILKIYLEIKVFLFFQPFVNLVWHIKTKHFFPSYKCMKSLKEQTLPTFFHLMLPWKPFPLSSIGLCCNVEHV